MTTAAATSALDRLRRSTRSRHERLDAGVAFTAEHLDAARYVEHLRRTARVVIPLEAAIAAAVGDDGLLARACAERRRAGLLERDLVALGSPVPATSWSGPAFEGAAAALGALYVLEGSTLGGRVLAGRARAVLGDDVPVAFLTTGGADVPARWAATRALLAAGLATDDDQCRAAAAAAAVFDVFVEVLLP